MKINWFKISHISIEELFYSTLINSNMHYLSCNLVLLKQGFGCKDCKEDYKDCYCNECSICGYNYCLCDINSKNFNEFIFNLIVQILSFSKIHVLLSKLTKFRGSCNRNLIEKYRNIIGLYENKLV